MSQNPGPSAAKEFVVRVPKPKDARKQYHVMRFHTANQVDFKRWSSAEMKRENNYKEFKLLDEDQPKFGAGSEFGREQRDEARRKRFGINVKKYAAERQPWLMSVKDRSGDGGATQEKKFKGIREGGVSDNSAWYVFMQASDGAFEAFPIDEWYNFQPVQRYNALNAEEAEEQFEKRDKHMNLFALMVHKKMHKDEEDEEEKGEGKKKKGQPKALKLSEIDDWMSDKDSDEDGEAEDTGRAKTKTKTKMGGKRGGKKSRTEDGDSGTDCEEESDDYDEGAEHEYESEDSSDSEQENDDKVVKDLAGVEEDNALKKLLDSDDEDEEEEKKEDEDKDKKKDKDSPSGSGDDSDEEKKAAAAAPQETAKEALKRKIVENPDLLGQPAAKKSAVSVGNTALSAAEAQMFEQHIRRYLSRKPMSTTEILQKLKSKKTGHPSEHLVEIIASMLKKINPQKRKVKGKMFLSLKS